MNKLFIRTTVSALVIVLTTGTITVSGNELSKKQHIKLGSALSILSNTPLENPVPLSSNIYSSSNTVKMDLETASTIPGAGAPISTGSMPVASGKVVHKNGKVTIDASNTADGYVMVAFTSSTTKPLMVLVTGPSGTKYTYKLNSKGTYEVFPLSDGNGKYAITVCENISGSKYAQLLSQSLTVTLKTEFAPFLNPNQYVDYTNAPNTIAKAKELVSNKKTDLEKIASIYTYVVNTLSYDQQKAQTVQSGYLPALDEVLSQKKGICFDYAALMTGMLRSQGIPCKLVIGYAGTTYHAWISVYTKENGWVEQAVLFDGTSWKIMDPTFASSSNNNPEVLQYIGNNSNYSVRYLY